MIKLNSGNMLEIPLRVASPSAWIDCVLEHFGEFLVDHAAAERKASASCMSYVVKYPDKPELVDAMIGLAREELEHFHDVCRLLFSRGLKLGGDQKNFYVNSLLALVRTTPEDRFLDKLLLSSICEARGQEKFAIVAKAHSDSSLSAFYDKLSRAEARHQLIYVHFADRYFPPMKVRERLDELLDHEAKIVSTKALTPSLY